MFKLAFPTGRDSETFQDKGTEVPSLSRDKGTTGQGECPGRDAGRDRPDFDSPGHGTRDGMPVKN